MPRPRKPIRKCPICGEDIHNRKAKTCGYRCGGIFQSQNSEMKYRLDAFDEWSDEMAYALGLIYSDGSLIKTQHSWRIQFGNTDLHTVQWFHQWIGNPGKITTTAPSENLSVKPHWKVKVRRSNKAFYASTTISNTLGDRLFVLGVRPRKSLLDLELPNIPLCWHKSFMRGVFDGDGGIWFGKNEGMKGGKNLHISISCSPTQARKALKVLLEEHNVRITESRIQLQIRGSQAEKFCCWIYDAEAGPLMTRKKDCWEAWRIFRKEYGGLLFEVGYLHDHSCVKGFKSKKWHTLIGTMSIAEVARHAGVGISRVYQVKKALADAHAT